jgi:G3E family GTPase
VTRTSAPLLTVTLVLGTCPPERRTVARQIAGSSSALVSIERSDLGESAHAEIDDAIEAIVRHPLAPRHLVLDCGSTVRPVDAVSAVLGHRDEAFLDAVVTVVDAAHLLRDLHDDEYVTHEDDDGDTVYTARSMITVEHIEYADTIAVAGRRGVTHAQLAVLLALLSHLNPTALTRLVEPVATRPRATPGVSAGASTRQPLARYRDSPFDLERFTTSPGWIAMLNGEHRPWVDHERVTTLRFDSPRPMHPERLLACFDGPIEAGDLGQVIRTAGFLALATRASRVGVLQHVGSMIDLEPTSFETSDPGAPLGQELVVTGIDLDEAAITAALHGCTLTDEELLAGPGAWARYPDAFTPWSSTHER